MAKMKTRSAAKKRLKKVGCGIKRAKSYRRHLLTKKTRKRKRQLRKGGYVHDADSKSMKQLLPY